MDRQNATGASQLNPAHVLGMDISAGSPRTTDENRLGATTLRKSLAQVPSSSFQQKAATSDRILHENVARIFSQHDALERMKAIEHLWTTMPVADAGNMAVAGRKPICEVAATFLDRLGGARCATIGRFAGYSRAFMLRREARILPRRFQRRDPIRSSSGRDA